MRNATTEPKTIRCVTAEALTLFIGFVRLNPQLSDDDPMMMGVLNAYNAPLLRAAGVRSGSSPEDEK